MTILRFALLGALVALVGGCSEEKGDPLLAGALTGEFEGCLFTPVNGFSTISMGKRLIGVGDGPRRSPAP